MVLDNIHRELRRGKQFTLRVSLNGHNSPRRRHNYPGPHFADEEDEAQGRAAHGT